MRELENSYVEGSYEIPVSIIERTEEGLANVRREVECTLASENSNVADSRPKATRKRKASDNEPRVALGTVDTNAPRKEADKRKGSQKKKEEQPATGTILTTAEHDKTNEANSVAVVLRHVLTVADTSINGAGEIERCARESGGEVESHTCGCAAPH